MNQLIECQKLNKYFAGHHAIDNLDLSVGSGKILGLVGANGAGKTTLLSLISGYLTPTSGEIRVFGEAPGAASTKGRIGILPQDAPFLKGITVQTQLNLFAELYGYTGKIAKFKVTQVLEDLKITEQAKQYPETLSFGQRKRVAIAQALLGEPELILLDEPTSGLDPVAANDVRNIIKKLACQCTLIISSHNLDEIDDICAEVIIIKQGKLVQHGSISELVERDSSLSLLFSKALPEQVQQNLTELSAVHDIVTDPANPLRITVLFNAKQSDPLLLEIMSILQKHQINIVEFSHGKTLTSKVVDLVA